ncbi:MAG: hypothetical protein C1O27_000801 [Chloroflexi bacterium]|nr:MAG: hypothetical protein C1O27_000801 [Chloroflexota bacterium]
MALVNKLFLILGPGETPQSPGHGIKETGFAVTVGATKAGNVHAVKEKRGDVFAIAEEISEREGDRYHALSIFK